MHNHRSPALTQLALAHTRVVDLTTDWTFAVPQAMPRAECSKERARPEGVHGEGSREGSRRGATERGPGKKRQDAHPGSRRRLGCRCRRAAR